MRLYNTLTRSVEEIRPLNAPTVTVYTCGPTVYDYPHIGNWFTFIRYDLLVRTLKADGLEAKWVMNITDVGHLVSDADEGEDKLEKGARRENKTAWEVAKLYTDYFLQALKRLHFTEPSELPKATEHIKEQIELIQKLEQKGFTYTIDDGVYYDTSRFEGYTAFARLDLDEQQQTARIRRNPQKRNASDFALWKFSPKDQQRDMEWDSPWGKGFPGWHVECSAMAARYLGETIDIHAGGIDHVPVHHTNEIAQSEAASGKRFANVWMHANHVLVEGEKISKSLGNGITLEDVESKGFSLQALRLHVLESHYQSQSKFSWESLEAAQNRLKAYGQMADQRWQTRPGGKVTASLFEEVKKDIGLALGNNLNTPAALERLSFLEEQVNTGLVAADSADSFRDFLAWLDATLGLWLSDHDDISPQQKELLKARQAARDDKDWSKSDALRDELKQQGVGVRDTDQGQVWFRL